MDSLYPTRPHYFAGQLLTADDFASEQQYHLVQKRRLNLATLGAGIVSGLELRVEKGAVTVTPGMAVDGYGREILLPCAVQMPLPPAEVWNVWLSYGRKDDPQRKIWLEEPLVELTPGKRKDNNPPAAIPPEFFRGFPLHLAAPDDPAVRWPVYLGRVEAGRIMPPRRRVQSRISKEGLG
jgi:hypothetical protein